MLLKPIFLVGLMGTGKSAVGRALAAALCAPFYDTDRLVEDKAGRSVSDIFAKEGEAVFRDWETEALRGLQDKLPGVVATGGGIVLKDENLALMEKMGLPILLTASLKTLEERLASERKGRPLLSGPNWREALASLCRERQRHYARLREQVNTDGRSVFEVVDAICQIVEKEGRCAST